MPDQKIDYTKRRLGSIVRRWSYLDKQTGEKKTACSRIAKCVKCGRKGERTTRPSKNGRIVVMVSHIGTIPANAPLPLLIWDEHCDYLEDVGLI